MMSPVIASTGSHPGVYVLIVVPVTKEYIPNVGAVSDSKVTVVNESHCINAPAPMVVTLLGMLIEVKELHITNVSAQIESKESGIVTDSIDVHITNAPSQIDVTDSGMVTDVREEQPWNA